MSRDLFDQMEDDDAHKFYNGGVSSNTIDLEMVLHYQTPDAVWVSDTGEESRAVWLPKSQIQMNRDGREVPAVKKSGQHTVLPVVTITIGEWLAKKEGLI